MRSAILRSASTKRIIPSLITLNKQCVQISTFQQIRSLSTEAKIPTTENQQKHRNNDAPTVNKSGGFGFGKLIAYSLILVLSADIIRRVVKAFYGPQEIRQFIESNDFKNSSAYKLLESNGLTTDTDLVELLFAKNSDTLIINKIKSFVPSLSNNSASAVNIVPTPAPTPTPTPAPTPAPVEKIVIVVDQEAKEREERSAQAIAQLEESLAAQQTEMANLKSIIAVQAKELDEKSAQIASKSAQIDKINLKYAAEISELVNRPAKVETVEVIKEVATESPENVQLVEENKKIRRALDQAILDYEGQKSALNEKYQTLLKEFADEHNAKTDALILLQKLQQRKLEKSLKKKKKIEELEKEYDLKKEKLEKAFDIRRADLETDFVNQLKKYQDEIAEIGKNNLDEERERLIVEYSQSWMEELRKFQDAQAKFFQDREQEVQDVLKKAQDLEKTLKQKSLTEALQERELQILGALFSLHFEGHKQGAKEIERVNHALATIKTLAAQDSMFESILRAFPSDEFLKSGSGSVASAVRHIPSRTELKDRWQKKVACTAETQAFVPHAYGLFDQVKAVIVKYLPEQLIEQLDDNIPEVFQKGIETRRIIQQAEDELINQDDIFKCTQTLQKIEGPAREAIEDWLKAATERATWEMFLGMVENECLSLTARIPTKITSI